MQVEREASRQRDGRVEIDDAYLGGSENNVSLIAALHTNANWAPLLACLTALEFTERR